MNTFYTLLFKFLMIFIFALVAFSLFAANPVGSVFTMAIVASIINYVIGDLLILPNFGNVVGSIGDGIMGALVAYAVALLIPGFVATMIAYLMFALLIAIGEFFFHQYLLKNDEVAPQ